MHHHAAATLAIALDVEAWGGSTRRTGGATATLAQQGWRAVGLGPRDRLETVWQELGRTRTLAAERPARRRVSRVARERLRSDPVVPASARPARGGLVTPSVLSLVGRVHHLGGAAVVEGLRHRRGAASWGRSWSLAIVVALSGALAALAAGARPAGGAGPARRGRRRRLALHLRLAVPVGEAWVRIEPAFQDASATAQQYAAPVRAAYPRSPRCSSPAAPRACCSSTSSPARCGGCRWPGCRC